MGYILWYRRSTEEAATTTVADEGAGAQALGALLAGLGPMELRGSPAVSVTGLAYNSGAVRPGDLFFCLRGLKADGHQFAGAAAAAGAVALVVERFLDLPLAQVRVPDSRAAMVAVSRRFFGHPTDRLGLVGVTGTNGKTTTTFYVQSVLARLGRPCALVGTVHADVVGAPEAATLTTPEAIDLQRLFRRAADAGRGWLVMEVSSHALARERVEPAEFDLAVLTNIHRDHFDFHPDYPDYLESKARLFTGLDPRPKGDMPKAAVLNADDQSFAPVASRLRHIPVITYGSGGGADVRATEVAAAGVSPARFVLNLPRESCPVQLRLPGRFNVYNALAAAAVGWQAGLDAAAIRDGLEALAGVPGRAEQVAVGQDFTVLVDFAHNPHALANLVTLRPAGTGGRTILVFGAEGGKDRGKRPEMGAAAAGADYCIITSDNMYNEDPEQVAREIARGLAAAGATPFEVLVDRRAAIERAVSLARPGDLVIIAGKGHERYWLYGGAKIPFDDREVVAEAVRRRLARAGGGSG